LRVLNGAGHLVFIECFSDVNGDVVTFLKTREARRRRPLQCEQKACSPVKKSLARL